MQRDFTRITTASFSEPTKRRLTMTPTCFTVDIKDNIAHIVLSRPEKRNSMNPAFWDELPQIVEDIDNNALALSLIHI